MLADYKLTDIRWGKYCESEQGRPDYEVLWASRRFTVRHCNALRPKRVLNQRENALSSEKPSMPAISLSGR